MSLKRAWMMRFFEARADRTMQPAIVVLRCTLTSDPDRDLVLRLSPAEARTLAATLTASAEYVELLRRPTR